MPDTNKQGAGSAQLDEAIAVLGQVNILIPVVYQLGKGLVDMIKAATSHGNVPQATKEEALAAIDQFASASADVRQTAETFLDTHPADE